MGGRGNVAGLVVLGIVEDFVGPGTGKAVAAVPLEAVEEKRQGQELVDDLARDAAAAAAADAGERGSNLHPGFGDAAVVVYPQPERNVVCPGRLKGRGAGDTRYVGRLTEALYSHSQEKVAGQDPVRVSSVINFKSPPSLSRGGPGRGWGKEEVPTGSRSALIRISNRSSSYSYRHNLILHLG